MEMFGAVASAVTLLGAAVKGTETLRQIISAFRGTSFHTESLDSAIKSLQTVLTQLKNIKALAEDGTDLDDFKELMKGYGVDIQRYNEDLKKIQVAPKESKTKQISKKLRAAISGDKALLRILGEITQRCTMIETQLSILQ